MSNHAMNRETNVRLFPHQNEKQYNQNNQQQSGGGAAAAAVVSSTTTEESLPVFDRYTRQSLAMEDIKTQFADSFGYPMPRAIAEQVLRSIRSGTPAYYYRYAIEETLLAPRPSWRYTLAIVNRLIRQQATKYDLYYRPGRDE